MPGFLVIFLLLGFFVRLLYINQSLWMDEAISGFAAKNFSYLGIINDFIRSDTHPPLYYLLLKFWTSIFGYSEISLRMPSVLFGTFTIFLVYRIGEIWGKQVARYAAILTAFSPLLVYYSQEARMYALSTFLVAFIVYSFLKKKWVWYSVLILILGATDYLPLIILFPITIYAFINKKYRHEIFIFFLTHVPLAIIFSVWFPVLSFQQNSTISFVKNSPGFGNILGVSNIKNILLIWIKFLIGRINFYPQVIYYAVVGMATAAVTAPLLIAVRKFKTISFLLFWFLVPILISFIVSLKVPGFSYFRLIFTLPAFILLISFGLSQMKFKKILFSLIVLSQIIFTGIYVFNSNYWREDWKSAVQHVEERIKTNERVFVAYPESFTPYDWYANKPGHVESFGRANTIDYSSLYTLDYLMDLTDPARKNYEDLRSQGFEEMEVVSFRGIGQIRYWVKK
jgi:mannosyltransferase